MAYDPSEPRDRSGKWSGGSARGHNAGRGNRSLVDRISTQHQRDAALAIGAGAVRGVAEGIAVSTALGALTGGIGELAAPGLIAGAVARGAIAGARGSLNPANIIIDAAIGGTAGLKEHREKMKSAIKRQHKNG